MKDLPRIASMLYCEPWAIRPEVHGQMCSQFNSYLEHGAVDRGDADSPVGPTWTSWGGQVHHFHRQVEVLGNIALIRVYGVLGKHLSNLAMGCGGYDLGLLLEQLSNVEMDDMIDTVVIDFRTPGGMTIGAEAAALAIRRVSEAGKKVIGYSDYDCCSCGYWLVSACDEFYTEGSALVGSISTFCAGVDSSKEWKANGRELMLFRTGDKKAIGLPGKKWTDEEKQFMQEKALTIDGDMKSFISQRRGLSADLMQGQYWYAKHAPTGLVDGFIPRLEDLVAGLME